jgi:hypothetical protein
MTALKLPDRQTVRQVTYRFSKMKIPAAMARIGSNWPRPLRTGIKVIRPQAMSQIASKSMPIFLVNLLMEGILFSALWQYHDVLKLYSSSNQFYYYIDYKALDLRHLSA